MEAISIRRLYASNLKVFGQGAILKFQWEFHQKSKKNKIASTLDNIDALSIWLAVIVESNY